VVLGLGNNQLSGNIPGELGSMTNLKVLLLNNNQLLGDVPGTLLNLVNLFDPGEYPPNAGDGLDLDYNYLIVPPGYPDPANPLHVFLSKKDPDWHLFQTKMQWFFLPVVNR